MDQRRLLPQTWTGIRAHDNMLQAMPALATEKSNRQSFCAVQAVPVLELSIHPQPLTSLFFSNRMSKISPAVSAAIHATWEQADMLDGEGFLRGQF